MSEAWLEEKARLYCETFCKRDLRPNNAIVEILWAHAARNKTRFAAVLQRVFLQAILWERKRAKKEGETAPQEEQATEADMIRGIVREEIRKVFTAWSKAAQIFGEEIGA